MDWVAAAEQAVIEPRWLDDVFALLRIPSISASQEHAGDVLACAHWLRDYIRAEGGRAELVPTKRQPLVVARVDATSTDPGNAANILLYAHFDVQPPGSQNRWASPPFEPEVREGWIYGRGTTDDKIHLFMLIRAVLDLAQAQELPVNVRLVSDGEEESIGDTIVDWLRADPEPIDFALALDGIMHRPGHMVFTTATRGLCVYTIEVETGDQDLHSGMFGGVGLNAVHVLNKMLAAVVPPPPELAVGSFEPSAEQAVAWDASEDWPDVLRTAGGRPISNAALANYNRTIGFLPSVDVNGVAGGDAELDTTIIPVRARAHVSLRLAPGQRTQIVCPVFEGLLRRAVHPNATVRIDKRAANPGSRTDANLPALLTVQRVFGEVMGYPAVTLPWGASVPLLSALEERGIPSVLTGFGLPDSALHAPNERFPLAYLPLGIAAIRNALVALGTQHAW